jgi:HEAT repeat protein
VVLLFLVKTDSVSDQHLITLIADHMENGFLENIIDMFRHDRGLYPLISSLIQDERVRVRVGVTALMEELKKLDAGNVSIALPGLLPLLSHAEPFVRGDTANLLGIIGNRKALPPLEKLLKDENADVRLIATEAIEEIRQQNAGWQPTPAPLPRGE